jgi:hypothetical protein
MEEDSNEQQQPQQEGAKTEVSELNELVSVIVDYYCFKFSYNGDDDEDEGDEWKKKMEGLPDGFVVPKKVDKLIEEAFSSQLKRFSKEK